MEKCSVCGGELGEGYTKLLGSAICARCLISPEAAAMNHRCFVCGKIIRGTGGRPIGDNEFAHVGNRRGGEANDDRDCYTMAMDEGIVTSVA
jgi:hypothetical protein